MMRIHQHYLYEMTQWFPRLAAYYDVYGWQHKQFLVVAITVPDDHIVASTGAQRARLAE